MNRARVAVIGAVLGLAACATADQPGQRASEVTSQVEPLRLRDRTIDLDAHLQGFPYKSPILDARAGQMFYKKTGARETLMMVAVERSGKVDWERGRSISSSDFSKRNLWGAFVNPQNGKVIIRADRNNDEIINFYELDAATGNERQLSHVAYIFGSRVSEGGRWLAYTSRAAKDELSTGEVHVLDLATGEDRIVFTDTHARKLTWGRPSWRPDNRGLLVPFMADADRNRRNLLYVPLAAGAEPRVLTDTGVKRSVLFTLNQWLSNDEFLYTSNESDFTGVYRASLSGGNRLFSPSGENVKDAALIEDGVRRQLVIGTGNPLYTELKLIDSHSGKTLSAQRLDEIAWFEDAYKDRLYVQSESLSTPLRITEIGIRQNRLALNERASYPAALLDKIVQCKPQKVSFETFDKLSAPGEAGMLHAYLLLPRHPRSQSELRGLVLSFYGGYNAYSQQFQILCEAGYAVLSPAPRGTTDFGEAFYNLAAGDWGGAETLDGFAAGRFLASRLQLPPARIGIFGGSRGGYDTLRALTFPGEVNGIREDFRFGFGVSNFGISDIARAAEGGNISQWYAMLTAGSPKNASEKWRERSPETHAALLSAPLLLTHGTNDNRVPVIESRSMYEKARSLGKDVTYVELPGQGHGYKGLESLALYYRTLLEFLDRLR